MNRQPTYDLAWTTEPKPKPRPRQIVLKWHCFDTGRYLLRDQHNNALHATLDFRSIEDRQNHVDKRWIGQVIIEPINTPHYFSYLHDGKRELMWRVYELDEQWIAKHKAKRKQIR